LIFSLFLATASAAETNSTWNYDNGGNDWGDTYKSCAAQYTVESPIDYAFDWSTYGTPTNYYLKSWVDDGFSYLPTANTAVQAGTYGFENWVYQLSNLSKVGGFYAAEPLKSDQDHQIYWKMDNIRFHSPAEHKINGTTYDVEMQIFGFDYYERSIVCSGKGATSIFFNIDPLDPDTGNDFFKWQADATAGLSEVVLDMSKVTPKTTAMTNNIYGYSGTDTMPGCDHVCWYALETPLKISTAQAAFFKLTVDGTTYDSNARVTGLGSDLYTAKFFWYGAFAPEPTPPVTPVSSTATEEL